MQKDNNLQNRFAEFGAAPNPEVWEKLEAELKEKRKKRLALLWWTGASFGVLSCILVFLFTTTLTPTEKTLSSTDQPSADEVVEVKKEKIEKGGKEEQNQEEGDQKRIEDEEEKLKRKTENNGPFRTHLGREHRPFVAEVVVKDELMPPSKIVNIALKDSLSTERVSTEFTEGLILQDSLIAMRSGDSLNTLIAKEETIETQEENQNADRETAHLEPKIISKWSFGLQVGRAYDYRPVENSDYYYGDAIVNSPAVNNEYTVVDKVTRYHKIIDLQLLAKYDFTKRWSFSTGLGYERFEKKVTGSDPNFNSWAVHGHLWTHPLQVNFNVLSLSKTKAFVGLGYTNSYFVSPTRKAYLGSAEFSLGLEYALKPQLSLRIQPYYQMFRVGQEIEGLSGNALIGGQLGIFYRPLK